MVSCVPASLHKGPSFPVVLCVRDTLYLLAFPTSRLRCMHSLCIHQVNHCISMFPFIWHTVTLLVTSIQVSALPFKNSTFDGPSVFIFLFQCPIQPPSLAHEPRAVANVPDSPQLSKTPLEPWHTSGISQTPPSTPTDVSLPTVTTEPSIPSLLPEPTPMCQPTPVLQWSGTKRWCMFILALFVYIGIFFSATFSIGVMSVDPLRLKAWKGVQNHEHRRYGWFVPVQQHISRLI